MQCGVCGSREGFTVKQVLWQQLVDEWQLSPYEAEYINAQQGQNCVCCRSNLRSVALAQAIRSYLKTDLLLRDIHAHEFFQSSKKLLEINEAGKISPLLRTLPGYHFGAYPEVDMHALPFPDESFDLVVHSDTLEHIANPVHALKECRRVLRIGGALCFTVPIVIGRMSRDRAGLPKSYHGREADNREDYVVHTEFGADVWTYLFNAGFSQIEMNTFGYPAGISLLARKT